MIETFYSVLIVSSPSSFTQVVPSLFPETSFYPVKIVESALQARRTQLFRTYDLVIINAPLKDESGIALALDAGEKKESSVLFLSPPSSFSEVEAKVKGCGIYTLKKPLSLEQISNAVRWLTVSAERIKTMEAERIKVEEKMEEIKIVTRAKLILIHDLKMSEEEAQKFIIKEAMDKSITKKEEAGIIINTYRPL